MAKKRSINNRLAKEYNAEFMFLRKHFQTKKAKKIQSQLSAPLLIYADKKYKNADIRLLFIGQQINTWGKMDFTKVKPSKYITQLMKSYKQYLNSPKKPKTHFWKVLEEFEPLFHRKKKQIAYIWTNLNKITRYKKVKHPEIDKAIVRFSRILIKELAILKPSIVIFLTGPAYDKKISGIFEAIAFNKVGIFKKKELARLGHSILPFNSYRTFHPNYLVRFMNKRYGKIVKTITEEIANNLG